MQYRNINSGELLDYLISNSPELDLEMIKKAIDVADLAHKSQVRDSGESYIVHPLNVAYILAQLKCDSDTICAGLLHDTIEDTFIDHDYITKHFNSAIANLVDGVTKLESFKYKHHKTNLEKQAENFRKLLIFTVKDYRVLILKLADRLHNMRTLEFVNDDRKQRIATETLEIYAPLANRFGLALIRWELEDLSFKYIQPEEYRNIVKLISLKRGERDKLISDCILPVRESLNVENIISTVVGRSKHFYSIYKKHTKKNISYNDIYDLAAIRIITNSIEDCYRALGIIHSIYKPIDNRFKDYISRPKPNQYQSLHTIVIDDGGRKIEFQIRTKEMHVIAEEGIAAHWKYKEVNLSLTQKFEHQISSIRKLVNKDFVTDSSFIDSLKNDYVTNEIIVITPKGDFIKLPNSASVLDFAFAIHSDMGLKCISANINGKFVPLRTKLKNGDSVSISTNKGANPSIDWLKIAVTPKAKSSIRAYFKNKAMEDAIILGKELFDKKIRKSIYRIKKDEEILELAKKFKYYYLNEFYAAIGNGKLLFETIIEGLGSKVESAAIPEVLDKINNSSELHDVIFLEDINNLMLKFAKCCNPKPGDDILGYVTRGKGITIHKHDCRNNNFKKIKRDEPFRLFKITWSKEITKLKTTKLEIKGENNNTVHFDIVKTLTSFNISILKNNFLSEGNSFKCLVEFDAKHFKNMKIFIHQLKKIEGVSKVIKT